MAPSAVQIRRIAEIAALLCVGFGGGLFMREITWPVLGNYPWLRLTISVLFFGGLVVLCLLCAYERQRVIQAAKKTVIIVSLLAIGVSLIYIYWCFPEGDQRNIVLVIALAVPMLLPAWLYVQFMWRTQPTIYDEYTSHLFRLHVDEYGCLPEPREPSCFYRFWPGAEDPTADCSTRPSGNVYKEKFEEVFGPVEGARGCQVRYILTLVPVLVATILIAAGWLYVMLPSDSAPTSPSGEPSVSEAGQEVSVSDLGIRRECFKFAFLGAYFFILQSLIRRYFQHDLKPDAYINAASRIIIVVLLVWVVFYAASTATSPDRSIADSEPNLMSEGAMAYLPILAFVIGVFPVVGWRFIETVIKVIFRRAVRTLEEHFPLHQLEGLNVWYESRLMEEGIENMQNLATANLVDVLLNTHVPVNRLVDWVDQSLLHLHLGESNATAREKLRRLGVRTATDIADLMESKPPIRSLARVLNEKEGEGPDVLQCINATLRDEPNFFHVRAWKSFPRTVLEKNGLQFGATRTFRGVAASELTEGTADSVLLEAFDWVI